MPFPIIPIVAVVSILGGAGVLKWYYTLSPFQREDADRTANEVAYRLFNRALNRLNEHQLREVLDAVKEING